MSPESLAGRPRLSLSLKLAASALALVAVAGCSQQPSRSYSGGYSAKEYFAEGKYGKASPRVVQMGEHVPKGGGRYLIGKPYRIAGRTYVPSEKQAGYSVTGTASWYGAAFHGRRTANGEIYDMASITAAHPTMPLPSYARVTNLRNGKSIVVRVNDRGPYHGGRVMDMSSRVADLLDFKSAGTARVKVDYLGKAGIGGSDDRQLAATLATGAPAQLAGYETAVETTTVAARAPEPAPPPEPARRQPAPPPLQPRAPEDEAQAAPAPVARAYAPRAAAPEKPLAPSKPTVLDAETEEAPAPPSPRAQIEAAPTADADEAAPMPASAPIPPRRPTAFNATAPDAAQDANATDADAPTTTTRRRAMARPLAEETAPSPRRRARDAAALALYYAPDATLAARFSAPGQPFSQLRDIAGDPGK